MRGIKMASLNALDETPVFYIITTESSHCSVRIVSTNYSLPPSMGNDSENPASGAVVVETKTKDAGNSSKIRGGAAGVFVPKLSLPLPARNSFTPASLLPSPRTPHSTNANNGLPSSRCSTPRSARERKITGRTNRRQNNNNNSNGQTQNTMFIRASPPPPSSARRSARRRKDTASPRDRRWRANRKHAMQKRLHQKQMERDAVIRANQAAIKAQKAKAMAAKLKETKKKLSKKSSGPNRNRHFTDPNAVLNTVREHMQNRRKDHVFGKFRDMDKDGSGSIDTEELKRGLMDMNLGVNSKELDVLMHKLDADGSGEVDFVEFFNMLYKDQWEDVKDIFWSSRRRQEAANTDDKVVAARELIEKRRRGTTQRNASEVLALLRQRALLGHVKVLFHQFNADRSGHISHDEFITALKKLDIGISDSECKILLENLPCEKLKNEIFKNTNNELRPWQKSAIERMKWHISLVSFVNSW